MRNHSFCPWAWPDLAWPPLGCLRRPLGLPLDLPWLTLEYLGIPLGFPWAPLGSLGTPLPPLPGIPLGLFTAPWSALPLLGFLWVPLAFPGPPLALLWPPLGVLLACLGLPLGSFWCPLVPLGTPLAYLFWHIPNQGRATAATKFNSRA